MAGLLQLAPSTDLAAALRTAEGYAAASKSPATRAAYAGDWRAFEAWCAQSGLQALPAAGPTVALYLAACAEAGRRPSTIGRYLAALCEAHRLAGAPSPRQAPGVRDVMRGIRRSHGVAPDEARPLAVATLRRLCTALPEGAKGIRDRALFVVGFAGALRRSELVALDVEDLTVGDNGLTLRLRRSKTDQEGAGRSVGLPFGSDPLTCPVRCARAWLDLAGIDAGAVFRPVSRHGRIGAARLSARSVARILQGALQAAGVDPAGYSGHSLRAGLCTAAAAAGKSERAIMAHTGHRSAEQLRRYIREGQLFDDNAAAGIGL